MSKHNTTPSTLSRRLTALLAALALLTALALPVYAEAVEDTTDIAQAEVVGTITDDPVTTEDDPTTPAGEETEDENSENNGDSLSGQEQDQNEAETDDSETQDDAADVIESPTQDNTDAEDQTKDETAEVSNEIATQAAAEDFTVYFAAPAAWGTPKQVTFIGKKGSDGAGGQAGNLEKDMSLVDDYVTSDGRSVYKVELHYQEPSDKGNVDIIKGIECPFNGYVWMKVKGDQQEVSLSNTWTNKDDFKGKCYIDGAWQDISELKQITPHQRLAGKTMYFKNATDAALENVQVVFYEKTDGEYIEVERQQQDNVEKGALASFTIPAEACAYVQILVNGQAIGAGHYNFYNDDAALAENAKFTYDSATNCCFTYSGENQATWGARSGVRLYFDATYSSYEYEGDGASSKKGIPTADTNSDHKVHCRFYDASGNSTSETLTMTKIEDASASSRSLWYIDIPEGKTYTNVRFSAWSTIDGTGTAQYADLTNVLTIPYNLTNPCFFADDGDDVTYNGGNANRDGYWGEKDSVRNAGRGKTGNTSVVDIAKAEFERDSNTKYINSTLYDYYTDWELNGNNRDDYKHDFNESDDNNVNNKFSINRNWAPFRQFDFAVSDYYATAGAFTTENAVLFPIYTGHFQPGEYAGNHFVDLKRNGQGGLDLFGFKNGRAFMAANNSVLSADSSDKRMDYYDYTFQGIVADQEVNGQPIMRGTENGTKLVEPHFNADFLKGNNSQKAKLGDVYENVSFPFTQADVFNEGVKYWAFDAADTTLYLKQDSSDGSYFLQQSDNRTASENRKSDSSVKKENDKTTYGFFPFNETIPSNAQASNYNYGFGAKLQFNFTLTEDGNVKNNNNQDTSIKFFFSGDDDVWVFIDGQLVLDVGGAHGKASGLLEFGASGDKNTVTPYVSKVKKGGTAEENSESSAQKTITYQGSNNKNETINFNYQGATIELAKGKTHTLTMYYMERGMWESNMAVAFNFPDHNELQVEKQVDLSNVTDSDFAACFTNQKLFNFTILNQATHYGTKEIEEGSIQLVNPIKLSNTDYKLGRMGDRQNDGNNYCKVDNDPQTNTGQVIHWYAKLDDTDSAYRDARMGVIKLNSTVDISEMNYLSFDLYTTATNGEGKLSLSNLYLQLVDNNGNVLGCIGKGSLSGTTYNRVDLKNDEWINIKLDLSKLTMQGGFDKSTLAAIRIGDNYQRHIYFKDFTFTANPTIKKVTGFTTEQSDIPDYGSAATGELKPAENAQFSSSVDGRVHVVDAKGRFTLQDKEVITFSDQFRRGSYLSVTEDADEALFETTWTIYENGVPVETMNTGTTVENTNPAPNVVGVSSYTPNDGRTEKIVNPEEQTDNKYTVAQKPDGDRTIVFRSYSSPDSGADGNLAKLKLQFVNKVKTGSLRIIKAAAADEEGAINDGSIYTFTVTFTNVGGLGLESKPIERVVKIQGTGEATISGIPVGTRFHIEETGATNGANVSKVEVSGGGEDRKVVNGKEAIGSITEDTTNVAVATFTNTKRTLIEIDLTKKWSDAEGNDLTDDNLPDIVYVQLQRKTADTGWTQVQYPEGETQDYVEVIRTQGGWTYKFTNLDANDYTAKTDPKPVYQYRVVEGVLVNGNFVAKNPETDAFLLSDGYAYIYKDNEMQTTEQGNNTITLTNTRQNLKFALDITKNDAENTNKHLAGVEFTLEKLDENGNVVENSAKYGVTDTNGKLMLKENGEITNKSAFTDLEAGKYRLTETKAKAGYNLLSAPIEVEFTKTGQCLLNGVKVEVWTAESPTNFIKNGDGSYTLSLTVLNRKTPTLPHTGADAPSLWLLIGLPLAVAGLLILVFRYNKKGGRTR